MTPIVPRAIVDDVARPLDFAIHAGLIYYLDSDPSIAPPAPRCRVSVASRTGGDATVLAKGLELTKGLATDGESLFIVASSAIVRLDVRGANVAELASRQGEPKGLIAVGDHVYWSARAESGRAIRRVAKSGGPVETVATGDIEPLSFVVAGREVIWADEGRAILAQDLESAEQRQIAESSVDSGTLCRSGNDVLFGALDSDSASFRIARVGLSGGRSRSSPKTWAPRRRWSPRVDSFTSLRTATRRSTRTAGRRSASRGWFA
jgi:hypothetical protein